MLSILFFNIFRMWKMLLKLANLFIFKFFQRKKHLKKILLQLKRLAYRICNLSNIAKRVFKEWDLLRRSSRDLILLKIFAEFLGKTFWRFLKEKILWRIWIETFPSKNLQKICITLNSWILAPFRISFLSKILPNYMQINCN